MKHFKHFALTMLVALVGNISAFAYDFEVDGIFYNIISSKELTCEVTYEKYENNKISSPYSGDVIIPPSVTCIGITFKVVGIGMYAFCNCKNLNSIEIPNSVKWISYYAFLGCTSLKSIEIPYSVNDIYPEAFSGCMNIESFNGKFASKDHRCLIVDGDLISFAPAGLTSYSIPNTVIRICPNAFQYCTELASVVIPNSVTTIDTGAFAACFSLSSVVIGNSVESIGGQAFYNCFKLTSIKLPNSLKRIERHAFENSGLTSIEIPKSVVSIGSNPFKSCIDLKTISVQEGSKNFYVENDCLISKDGCLVTACSNKELIEIPSSVKTIGSEAFYGDKFTSVEIPNSVNSIEFWALCNLTSVYVEIENPNDIKLESGAIYYYTNGNSTLYVPKGSKELYEAADQWKDFSKILEMEFDIADVSPYNRINTATKTKVNYTRNFTSTAWQALYIPFPMKYEDWADKADVAYINNVHQWDDDNDGVIDRTVLEFITKKNGSIEANKPYVIRPKQTGEVTFTSENTTLYATPETDGYVDCMSTTNKYTLYGTYQEKTDMYAKGYYAMSDGGFKQAESASMTLLPFRAYLKIESRTGAGAVQNAKRINIMVDGVVDNDVTGIEEITQNSSLETQNCYNLAGQKVSCGYKGIAIKNGKKYIVK